MPNVLCTTDGPTDMKVLPQKLRKLREERAWTQEHLALVAGLSLRTIQRIERDGNVSSDSRLALAAALEVGVSDLSETSEGPTAPLPPPSTLIASPPATPVEPPPPFGLGDVKQHLRLYLILSVCFVAGDFLDNHRIDWAWWPISGWGLGIVLHGWHDWKRTRESRGLRPPTPEHLRRRHAIRDHVVAYLAMSVVFLVGDLWENGGLTWAFYPILGWGLGLFLHARQILRTDLDR